MLQNFLEMYADAEAQVESVQKSAPSPNPNGEKQKGIHPNANEARYHSST